MISNSKYNVTVRVDNTVFFCQTDIGNRERIDKLLADMGY